MVWVQILTVELREVQGKEDTLFVGCVTGGWSCHLLTMVHWGRSSLSEYYPLNCKGSQFINTAVPYMCHILTDDFHFILFYYYLSSCIHGETSFWQTNLTLLGQLTSNTCLTRPGPTWGVRFTLLYFILCSKRKYLFSASLTCSL